MNTYIVRQHIKDGWRWYSLHTMDGERITSRATYWDVVWEARRKSGTYGPIPTSQVSRIGKHPDGFPLVITVNGGDATEVRPLYEWKVMQ